MKQLSEKQKQEVEESVSGLFDKFNVILKKKGLGNFRVRQFHITPMESLSGCDIGFHKETFIDPFGQVSEICVKD